MKKILVIILLACIILAIGLIGFILWSNRTISTILLEINPSIEIQLNKKNIVKNVIAKNKGKKDTSFDSIKGKELEDCIDELTSIFIDKEYMEDNEIKILIYATGEVDSDWIGNQFIMAFDKKNIVTQIITVPSITKEDKKLAKKYQISSVKAAYIQSIRKKYPNIPIDHLKNRTIRELSNTKEMGWFCDDDYELDGDRCFKEIKREDAKEGMICPEGYTEYNSVCYEETRSMDGPNYACRDDYQLIDNECIFSGSYHAHGNCDNGDYDGYDTCIIREHVADAYEFCRDPGRTLYEHKCLATKPSINGGCLNNDLYLNGSCVNTVDDYYLAEWKCPNGQVKSNHDGSLVDDDTKCYEEKKVAVTSYYCDDGDTLVGNQCQILRKEKLKKEQLCPDGYQKIEGDRCININNSKDKVEGYYCDQDNHRLKDNICIFYEILEAQQ